MRGTPRSVCQQPEPNATELPSRAPISARASQKRRRRRWWNGEEGARRPGPEGQVLRHVLWHVPRNALRRVVHVPVLHVSPKSSSGGGSHPGRRAQQHTFFGAWVPPLEDGACHDGHLHAPTAESVRRLSNWHNKRVRDMCRVTMCQMSVHRITSESLQKRTGVFSLEHYLASRTLLWAWFEV